MENSLKITFQFLEDITDLRYEVEQNLIDKLHSRLRSNNTSIDPLVKNGFDFVNAALEGRYSMERDVLKRIKTQVNKSKTSTTGDDIDSVTVAEPNVIHSGTIVIKSLPSQKKVSIPLTINNNFDFNQEVTAETTLLKHMKTGDSILDKIKLDTDHFTMPPKGSTKLNLTINLAKDFKPEEQYFTTLIIKGKEVRVFQIILEILSGKNKKEKSSMTLLPSQGQ